MTDEHEPLALPATASAGHYGTMLPLPEAAARLGRSVQTVRRMVTRGELEGAEKGSGPFGPQWLVPLATVESLLARRQATALPHPMIQARPTPDALEAALVELKTELAATRAELATERAVSAERAQQLEALHSTMRTLAITAASTTPATRKRWWRRTNTD